jgi:hypothetical protein
MGFANFFFLIWADLEPKPPDLSLLYHWLRWGSCELLLELASWSVSQVAMITGVSLWYQLLVDFWVAALHVWNVFISYCLPFHLHWLSLWILVLVSFPIIVTNTWDNQF